MLCLQAVWKDKILYHLSRAHQVEQKTHRNAAAARQQYHTQGESPSIEAVQFPLGYEVIKIWKDALYFLAGVISSIKHEKQGFPKY